MKKKIVFITRESSDMPAVRVRCHGFGRILQTAGFDTMVFSYADTLGAKSGKQEHFMKVRDKLGYNIKALRMLLKEDAIFVIQRFHYHSFAPLLAGFIKRNKIVFDLDDWEARENTRDYLGVIPNSKAIGGMRFTCSHSCLCLGASKFLTDFMSLYNKNVMYVPTGVDIEKFIPNNAQSKRDKIIISWLGTMHRLHNVSNIAFLMDCFMEINKRFDNICLEITGDGVYADQVRTLIAGCNNNNIIFKSWLQPDDIPSYMSGIDIGVMPLIQDTKFNQAKSPTRLFEYMAMEKPVVVSNMGEAARIIKDNHNGLLADSKSNFKNALARLIENRILRKALGANARKTVEQEYSLQVLGEQLVGAINDIC